LAGKSEVLPPCRPDKKPFFHKAAILGVGLIGASLALALKRRRICNEIWGFGRRESNLVRAKGFGIIDSLSLDLIEAVNDADLIVFAMPVGVFVETASIMREAVKEGAVVTDVGSVKGRLVYEMEELFCQKAFFIGAHPIAGSEKSGIDTADADLFEGNRCIITPTERSSRDAFEKVTALWENVGARVETMTPENHDSIFGVVSHLPHIIAFEIVNIVQDINGSYLRYAGQGFRDLTRIASSSPDIWKDVCIANRVNLVHDLTLFIDRLERVKQYLSSSEARSLEEEFRRASLLRDSLGQD
jgi:prephenate dehydrogenase